MIIHFDADLLVYRCGFAAEKTHRYLTVYDEFEEGTISHFSTATALKKHVATLPDDSKYDVETVREAEPVENALHSVRLMVEKVLDNLACSSSELRMYLTGPTNYRNGVATIRKYKGNRDKAPKPIHGPAIREYIQKHYECNVSVDEEADDVVGYSHYAMYLQDDRSSVICTVDKDIDMIPGLHYNFIKEESYYVDDDKADRYFYHQLLTGDATDNIPGLPGVGPKTAAKVLKDAVGVHELYNTCRIEYAESEYEDGDEALLENARLLWIRRHPDEWWLPPVEDKNDE